MSSFLRSRCLLYPAVHQHQRPHYLGIKYLHWKISATVQTLIISEAVDLEEKLSGHRPTALFFSMQTFIVKIGAGISSLAASLGYVIIKFSSAETEKLNRYIASGGIPRLNDKYSTLMTTLFFLYTIPVAISSLLSAIPFINKYKH